MKPPRAISILWKGPGRVELSRVSTSTIDEGIVKSLELKGFQTVLEIGPTELSASKHCSTPRTARSEVRLKHKSRKRGRKGTL